MRTARRIGLGLSFTALAIGLGCGGDGSTGPQAGTAKVALVTPNSDDGAVLLTLTGPGLSNVQPTNPSYVMYVRSASASEVRVILVGNLIAGPVLTVDVDDVGKLGQYHGTVVDAASRSDAARGSTSGYGVTLARK